MADEKNRRPVSKKVLERIKTKSVERVNENRRFFILFK